MESLIDSIIINLNIMVRKPVIKVTRVFVQHILCLLAQGTTYGNILEERPRISKENIHACLFFAQQALIYFIFAPIAIGNSICNLL